MRKGEADSRRAARAIKGTEWAPDGSSRQAAGLLQVLWHLQLDKTSRQMSLEERQPEACHGFEHLAKKEANTAEHSPRALCHETPLKNPSLRTHGAVCWNLHFISRCGFSLGIPTHTFSSLLNTAHGSSVAPPTRQVQPGPRGSAPGLLFLEPSPDGGSTRVACGGPCPRCRMLPHHHEL